MSKGIVAKASTDIGAPVSKVWDALVNPATISKYMFGARVFSDWKVGSPIRWKGEWKGKPYEDEGVVRRIEPERLLEYSHFSPLSGLPDVPENHHVVTIELVAHGARTLVTLTQDNNSSDDARAHAEANWKVMLDGLKKVVEV